MVAAEAAEGFLEPTAGRRLAVEAGLLAGLSSSDLLLGLACLAQGEREAGPRLTAALRGLRRVWHSTVLSRLRLG